MIDNIAYKRRWLSFTDIGKMIEKSIDELITTNNANIPIRIEHYHLITKDINKATTIVGLDNNSDAKVKIIKEMKDPNNSHKYTMKKVNAKVNNRLVKLGININFNQHTFGLFDVYYSIKKNPKFCFVNNIYQNPQYSYSIQLIDFIIDEIKKDPNIMQNIKGSSLVSVGKNL